MTDQQRIAEITARCDAATPGPWRQAINYSWGKKLNVEPNVCFCQEECNAAFIAHASDDIPYLLTQLAEREREIERLREAQRWIPVTERLPEQSGAYWVNLRQEDKDSEEAVDFCVMAWYWPNKLLFAPQEVGWILLNEWYEFSDKMRQYITHWMPLPLPATPEKGA